MLQADLVSRTLAILVHFNQKQQIEGRHLIGSIGDGPERICHLQCMGSTWNLFGLHLPS